MTSLHLMMKWQTFKSNWSLFTNHSPKKKPNRLKSKKAFVLYQNMRPVRKILSFDSNISCPIFAISPC